MAASGAFADGLSTTALPVTRAAPSAPQLAASGSAHGMQERDHAARLAQHEVPAWRAIVAERAELGVGLKRCDSGLDTAEGAREGRSALERLELGQLARVLAQPAGGGLQQSAARLGRGARPRDLRRARGGHGLGGFRGAAGRNVADRLARGGIDDRQLGRPGSGAKIERAHRPVRTRYPAAPTRTLVESGIQRISRKAQLRSSCDEHSEQETTCHD